MNIWSKIRDLKGETLNTLSRTRKREFKILDVCEKHIFIFIFSSQKERKISKEELEKSAEYLFKQKSLTRAQIRNLFSVANPAYVAGILAKMPSVSYGNKPITLYYRKED